MDNVYKIRTIFVYFAFLALYLTIIFNLFIIQIKHTNFFANLGEKQYTITITQTPSRAPIFDRHGMSSKPLRAVLQLQFFSVSPLVPLEAS